MKTRLNIFSLLIVSIFILATAYEVYTGMTDFRQGFKEGYSKGNEWGTERPSAAEQLGMPYYLKLSLNTTGDMPVDSVYNKVTQKYHPAEYTAIKFYPQEDTSFLIEINNIFMSLLIMIVFPVLIVCFWKVITSVKKAIIFERNNIRRLRIIGSCFALLAVFTGIPQLLMEIEATRAIAIEGYSIIRGEWFMSSLWIYSLISFIVAETFAIGLRLKEEQDLTI